MRAFAVKIGVSRGGTPVRALKVVSAYAGFFMRAAPAHPSDLCGGLLRRAFAAGFCGGFKPPRRQYLRYSPLASLRERGGRARRACRCCAATRLTRTDPPLTRYAGGVRSAAISAALRGRAVSAAYGRGLFCAVSGASRPRPLRGVAAGSAPPPSGLCGKAANMAAYFQQAAIFAPRVGGAARRGAPIPCPRRPAPPMSLRCARSLVMRPVRASLAGLLILARLSAPLPPYGRLGGSPYAPAPCVRALWVALLPVAPSLPLPHGRAAARPHALAGCFGGKLCSRPSMVGPSLSAARPSGGRTLVRAPLGMLSVNALLSRHAYGLAVRYAPRIAIGWPPARSPCRVRYAAASVKQPLKTGYRPLFNLK